MLVTPKLIMIVPLISDTRLGYSNLRTESMIALRYTAKAQTKTCSSFGKPPLQGILQSSVHADFC
jgi:hypothetical protein